jgi:hypothetical protein
MTVTVIDAQDNLGLVSLLFTSARACLLLKRLGTVIHGLCPQLARSGNAKRLSHRVFKAVEPLIRSISQLIVGCGVAVNKAHDCCSTSLQLAYLAHLVRLVHSDEKGEIASDVQLRHARHYCCLELRLRQCDGLGSP